MSVVDINPLENEVKKEDVSLVSFSFILFRDCSNKVLEIDSSE